MNAATPFFRSLPAVTLLALAMTTLGSCGGGGGGGGTSGGVVTTPVQAPVLKWAHGGCTTWCNVGWYSSPGVADLDGDTTLEVIGGGYTLFALNGEDGTVQWQFPSAVRTWPDVIIDDIDNDTDLEILIGQASGHVVALSHTGSVAWDQTISASEVRSLSAYDLDNDNTSEVIAGLSISNSENIWVLEHNGGTRTGWPQLSGATSSVAWGIYNSNISVGDIDNNNSPEIYAPSDTPMVVAYYPDGGEVPANAIFGTNDLWGMVPAYESPSDEIQGWTACTGPRDYRANFATGPSVIADVDNDGTSELIVVGNIQAVCGTLASKYNGVFIFNSDRTRFHTTSYDWSTPPLDLTGPPLSEDFLVIEAGMPNPAVADLDNDGKKEIIFSSYDGKVHAVWLDKTEHGNWPFAVNQTSEAFYRLSGEPLVADLNNDGKVEVIVASWTEKGSNANGKLHILDSQGTMLFETTLPDAPNTVDWNGALAAPTLANVDDDSDLEIVINTARSGIVVYDLPGTDHANILWGTGRGNYLRNGSLP